MWLDSMQHWPRLWLCSYLEESCVSWGWVPMATARKPVNDLIPQQAQILICFAGAFLDKCLHTADAEYTAHARVHAGLNPFSVWVHAVTKVSTRLMLDTLRVQ